MDWIPLLGLLILAYVVLFIYIGCSCLHKWRLKLIGFITGNRNQVENREAARAQDAREGLPNNIELNECPICLE